MSNKSTRSKLQYYWILQVIGWSSIIFIETINYTHFIAGEFRLEHFQQFCTYSLVGLLFSYAYKTLFIRPNLFEKTLSRICFRVKD